MPSSAVRRALLKNKYCIVKRTLRLTRQPINEAVCAVFDEAATLDEIETRLKMHTEPGLTEIKDGWLTRWLK